MPDLVEQTQDALERRFSGHAAPVPEDFAMLLEHVIPLAVEHLAYEDFFAPFASAQSDAGPADVAPEFTSGDRVYEPLHNALRAGAEGGRYRATALVWDATATPADGGAPTDLIVAKLDHQRGPSATAYVPYTRTAGHVELKELYVEDGAGDIFPAQMA